LRLRRYKLRRSCTAIKCIRNRLLPQVKWSIKQRARAKLTISQSFQSRSRHYFHINKATSQLEAMLQFRIKYIYIYIIYLEYNILLSDIALVEAVVTTHNLRGAFIQRD